MNDSHLPLAPTRTRQRRGASSKNRIWTEMEDAKLIGLIKAHTMANNPMTPINWFNVASYFPNKTQSQVFDRWIKVLDPTLLKGSWTREEDETIIAFVKQNGRKHWSKLANLLPGRLGKQVRERWVNHLDPNVNRGPWTPEEDELIIELHKKYGNHWTYIGSHLPSRSDNAIKNRWNSTLSKRFCDSATMTPAPTPVIKTNESPPTTTITNSISSSLHHQQQQLQFQLQQQQQQQSQSMSQLLIPPTSTRLSMICSDATKIQLPPISQLPSISPHGKTKLPSISILGQSQSDRLHLVTLNALNSPILPPLPSKSIPTLDQMGLMNLIFHQEPTIK